MVGLGKHIQGIDAGQTVRPLAKHFQVAAQGFRVAGNVHHARRGQPQQAAQGNRLAAGAGRVQNHHVGGFGDGVQHILGFAQQKLHVVQPGGVFPRVGNGGGGLFNSNHFPHVGGQQYGKGADAGVGVEEQVVGGQGQLAADGLNQVGGLPDV